MAERPDFDNPALWEVFKDINVFAEHTRTVKGKDGRKRTITFNKPKLERIARTSNERDEKGQPCPLMLGHTDDDAPETHQPPIAGYARRFKVAYDKRLGKWVVRASYYLKRSRAAEAKEYPRTSVEVWSESNFFDPIALLKRTPQLDLGQWTYGRGSDLKLRYSMDDLDHDDGPDGREPPPPRRKPLPPDDEDEGGGEGEGDLPPEHDGPEGVPPDFHHHFMKCMKHHGLKSGHGKYGLGDANGLQGGGPPRVAGPMPLPRDEDEEEGGGRGYRRRDSRALKNARQQRPEDGALRELMREVRALRDDVAEVKGQRQETEAKYVRQVLKGLEDEGYHFNHEREEAALLRMNDAEREDHLAYMREIYTRAPVGNEDLPVRDDRPQMQRYRGPEGDMVRVTGGVEGGGRPAGEPDEAELDRAVVYMREHPGTDWDEAVKAIRTPARNRNGRR